MILWGPPGSGKTTLAEIVANMTKSHFSPVSAVTSGVADLRRVIEEARERRRMTGQRTILFIDEIHRFNKGQQDTILPFVEDGTITLIGATTENPSFEVVSPLLSRSRVYTLNALADEDIRAIVQRALEDTERGLGGARVAFEDGALDFLVTMANGDARVALTALEMAVQSTPEDGAGVHRLSVPVLEDVLQRRVGMYDKGGEEHYNIISAFIKSMRSSDPDAALYWMARMVEGGEDPLFIIRRMVIFAAEDVGLADPQALVVATACQQAVHFVGMPEGFIPMAEACVYLATAPKSNASYAAYNKAVEDVRQTRNDPVPLHLRNAPTGLMKGLGYGKGYKYAHDYKDHYVEMQNRPDRVQGHRYYEPGTLGYEQQIIQRMKQRGQLREEAGGDSERSDGT
jgi:putative ATPase